MEGDYSVKRKNAEGKFWSFGNVKKNQFGNYQLGLKVTPELRAVIHGAKDGEWVNWSLFLDDGAKKGEPQKSDTASGIPF